ncbi:MAG: hypothetical protein Q8M07_20860, partial [Prosthecobacter sp.]|nr:hypothetical protein [Prosthecobacter sp.]
MSRCTRRLTCVRCGGWAMSSCRSSAVIKRGLAGGFELSADGRRAGVGVQSLPLCGRGGIGTPRAA